MASRLAELAAPAGGVRGGRGGGGGGGGGGVGGGGGEVGGGGGRVGGLDQPRCGLFGIAGPAQRVADRLGADHAGEAVGAQQVPVTGPGVVQRGVQFHGGAVDGTQQQRPLRV